MNDVETVNLNFSKISGENIAMRKSLATFANKLFPGIRFSMDPEDKALYLTFDDGPHPESTPIILDLLSKHNAKATFFCLGRNVEKYPSIFDSILSEGHAVGNHSWSHPNGWLTSTSQYLADIEKASKTINSRLFRPPYGRITPTQYLKLRKKFNIIMWTRQFADYSPRFNPEKAKLNPFGAGDVVVLHDTRDTITNTSPLLNRLLIGYSGIEFSQIPDEAL